MTTATPCNDAVVRRFRWWKWMVPLLLGALLLAGNQFLNRQMLDAVRANAGNAVAIPTIASFDGVEIPETDVVRNLSIKQPNMRTAGMANLNGTCDTGRTHNLVIDGEIVDTFDCPDGTWAWSGELAEGNHDIALEGLLADGSVGGRSPLNLPLLGAGAAALAAATFDLPDTGDYDTGAYTLSGVTAPNGEVDIIVNGSRADRIGADGDGNWSFDLDLSEAGEYTVGAYALNEKGQAVTGSGFNILNIKAPEVADAEPEEEEAAEEEAEEVAEEATEEPTEEPTAVAEANFDLSIIGQNEDASGNAANGFFGTGPAGIRLEILEGDRVVGGAIVLEDGSWRCGCQLAPGEHTLYVRDADNPDNVSNEITILVENPAPAYETPTGAVDPNTPKFSCADVSVPPTGEIIGTLWKVAPCETLGWIAARAGTTVAELIAYNPQIAGPSQIYAGQLLNIPLDAACFDVNTHSEG